MKDRAQSEAVGMLAVTVVVVLLTSTVGFALVESTVSSESAAGALGDYRFDADAAGISVIHVSGDALPLSELALVVRGPDGHTRRPFTAGALAEGGTVFAPGTTWRYAAHPFPVDRTVELDVLVVHRASETVVDGTTLLVRASDTPTPTATPTPTGTPTPTPDDPAGQDDPARGDASPPPTATASPTAAPPSPTPVPPTVESFEVTNPGGHEIRVELRTAGRLENVSVVVRRGTDGAVETTLTEEAFTEAGDGPYTYVATTTAERTGNYRVELAMDGVETAPGVDFESTRWVHVDDSDDGWWDEWWGDGDWWGDGNWWDSDDSWDDSADGSWWADGWWDDDDDRSDDSDDSDDDDRSDDPEDDR